MTNLSDKYTHKAICAVCFRDHFLNPARGGENPIRHGFHVVGVGGGHQGAWHTGPCAGVGFRHFGVSTDGAVWALGQIDNAIVSARKLVAGLEARPDLNWHFQPKKYQAATWQVRKSTYVAAGPEIVRVLTPGTEAETITYPNPETDQLHYRPTCEVKAPSYEQELAHRLGDANGHLNSLLGDKAKYELAIANWKLVAPVPCKTVKVVHLARASKSIPNLTFADCNRRIQSYSENPANMTKDKTKVTCERCKKSCK